MRSMIFSAVLATVWTVSVATAAPGKQTLEILGIHHGDTMAAADATLKSNGFRADPDFMHGKDDCSKSYVDLIDIASRSTSGISDMNMVRCETDWRDAAGQKVHLVSVVTPSGYRVSRLRYAVSISGGAASVAPALTKKFGPAPLTPSRMGGAYRNFTGADPGVVITLSDDGFSKSAAIMLLSPRDQYTDDQRVMTAVQQAAAQARTGGKLKL